MLNFLGRWVSHQLIPVSFWKWHAHCFFVFFFALWRGELFMENWIKMRRTTCKDLWKVCSIQKVIFHCIYVTHILYLFFYWWAFRLLQCPGCCTVVTSAAMNIAGTLLNSWWCLNWKEVQKGGDMLCICMTDSFCCTVETNTILYSNYTSTKTDLKIPKNKVLWFLKPLKK